MKIWLFLFGVIAWPGVGELEAQGRPSAGPGDPRIQSIDYIADQVVLIEAAPGYQVTIELAPDERIESAAVGDSGAWQVSVNRARNYLFLKPLQAGVATNMTIVTNVRLYAFDLSALSSPTASTPYTVRFRYAPSFGSVAPALVPPAPASSPGRYKVTGQRELRPAAIWDDGIHTYIKWVSEAGLPASYVIDEDGREMLANGNMRDGIYVIDTVARHLEFRIDRRVARAFRLRSRKRSS